MATARPFPSQNHKLPEGFCYITDIHKDIRTSVRYAGSDNFIGEPFVKYQKPVIIISEEAAHMLSLIQDRVSKDGFDLVIYDAYRPQATVDSFRRWAENIADQRMKEQYYPRIDKAKVHELGYIARRSTHSRGSTVDLTIIQKDKALKASEPIKRKLADGFEFTFLDDGTVDMGSHFDLFDEASWHDSPLVGAEYSKWRNYLRDVMVNYNFEPYSKEWWHYTLAHEPFAETYFDFDIA